MHEIMKKYYSDIQWIFASYASYYFIFTCLISLMGYDYYAVPITGRDACLSCTRLATQGAPAPGPQLSVGSCDQPEACAGPSSSAGSTILGCLAVSPKRV